MTSDNQHMYKRVGMITLLTLVSRVLGAVRDLVITHIFGAGVVHDAYVVAQTIPNVFRRLTAEGSMTLAFMPIYAEVREKYGHEGARRFAQKALFLILIATLLITTLGIIFSESIVYLFASGFSQNPEKYALTIRLTEMMFPYLILVSLVAWAMGVLNAEKYFAAPAAAPIFLNVGMIFGAVLLAQFLAVPIEALAWGMLLGGLFQILVQLPSLKSVHQSIVPIKFWGDPDIKRLLWLLAPSLFGVAVYQLNMIILRTLASDYPDGHMTYYYIASRLTELVLGMFAFGFVTAAFPDLNKQSAQENWKEMGQTIKFTISGAMMIIVPATVGLMAAAEPILAMLYLHGKFTVTDLYHTVTTLQAFCLSIPAVALIRILVPIFFSFKDTKTPVWISVFSLISTALLGWWWGGYWQVVGLSLGLTVGTWIQALLLYGFLRRKKQLPMSWLDLPAIMKYTITAIFMGAITYGITHLGRWDLGFTSGQNWLIFLSVLVISPSVYFGILLILKDQHCLNIIYKIKGRFFR